MKRLNIERLHIERLNNERLHIERLNNERLHIERLNNEQRALRAVLSSGLTRLRDRAVGQAGLLFDEIGSHELALRSYAVRRAAARCRSLLRPRALARACCAPLIVHVPCHLACSRARRPIAPLAAPRR